MQRFNTAFLQDTDKLNEFKITLNNRLQALQEKKGNLSKYENYKGITLPSVPGEVFSSVAELEKDAVDAQLRDQQA
ncbi:unnamed protein product [Schistosoma mattheei]|uniref:Uncharacterized protein n=1 Tax=Schistosoma mattheei TaxID=31246 RepID=A0A183PZ41_9TREM|nr:unnamed protein product [Schistosoma mattheei]